MFRFNDLLFIFLIIALELSLEDDQYTFSLQLFLLYMFTKILSTKKGPLQSTICLALIVHSFIIALF